MRTCNACMETWVTLHDDLVSLYTHIQVAKLYSVDCRGIVGLNSNTDVGEPNLKAEVSRANGMNG